MLGILDRVVLPVLMRGRIVRWEWMLMEVEVDDVRIRCRGFERSLERGS